MNFDGLTFSNFGEITILRLAERAPGVGRASPLLPTSIQSLSTEQLNGQKPHRDEWRDWLGSELKGRFRELQLADRRKEGSARSVKRVRDLPEKLSAFFFFLFIRIAQLVVQVFGDFPRRTERVRGFFLFLLTLPVAFRGRRFFSLF